MGVMSVFVKMDININIIKECVLEKIFWYVN